MDYLRKKNMINYERDRKIKEIAKEELNQKCIDCNYGKPEYISINNAVFICKNCYKKYHEKFQINISRTVNNNLKALSLKELDYLYLGGNKKMLEYMKYEYPKLIKINSFLVYKTIALEYYRKWLTYLVEGGNKPIKPDIEIAYNSIEDKKYNNNNIISNHNSDVITIDFFNDCYNYNDKYNNSITNFIKKKPESNRGSFSNNNNTNNNRNDDKLKDQDEKAIYQKLSSSNNIKDFLNYYKTVNKYNYNYGKYMKTSHSNLNEIFSKTHSNFINLKNKANQNDDNDYIKSRSNRMSQKNIIKDINKNFDLNNENNEKNKFNYNNNKILKAFKTNNRIYMKPKHNFIKSFDRDPSIDEHKKKEEIIVNEFLNNSNEKEIRRNIRVKRDLLNHQNNFEENKKENINENNNKENKENKGRNIDKKIDSYFTNENKNESNYSISYNYQNKIKVGGARSKYAKKKIYNNFSVLNKTNDEKDKNKAQEKEKEKEKNDIAQNNENELTKPNINDNNYNLSNIVFKKKNLRNNFYLNDKKLNKNSSTVDKSNADISKNGIETKNWVDTTRDEGKSYEESYDDTQNTVQSFSLNKSMRQFYSRYPRRMKRAKTNRRKLNEEKKKEKREKSKIIKLKKEKSEILKSLKLLLKKKEEIKIDKENKNEENNNADEDNKNDNKDLLNKYKSIDNDNRKKIFVNKIKNEELNKIMIDDMRKNRKESLKMNNNNNINNKNYNTINVCGIEDDKKNNDNSSRKKIYVKQNEELIQKADKNSIRSKYKNRRYKI